MNTHTKHKKIRRTTIITVIAIVVFLCMGLYSYVQRSRDKFVGVVTDINGNSIEISNRGGESSTFILDDGTVITPSASGGDELIEGAHILIHANHSDHTTIESLQFLDTPSFHPLRDQE